MACRGGSRKHGLRTPRTGVLTAWSDRWYHYDLTGNITGELDASGLVQSHVWMEAFGTVVSGGQTGRRLTTKTYDAAAGLYYFSARWYGATHARWYQTDSTRGDGWNYYWFGRSNPLVFLDVTGWTAILAQPIPCPAPGWPPDATIVLTYPFGTWPVPQSPIFDPPVPVPLPPVPTPNPTPTPFGPVATGSNFVDRFCDCCSDWNSALPWPVSYGIADSGVLCFSERLLLRAAGTVCALVSAGYYGLGLVYCAGQTATGR